MLLALSASEGKGKFAVSVQRARLLIIMVRRWGQREFCYSLGLFLFFSVREQVYLTMSAFNLEKEKQKLLKLEKEQLADIILAIDREREEEIEKRIGSIKKKLIIYQAKVKELMRALDYKNEMLKLLENAGKNVHLSEIIIKKKKEIENLQRQLSLRRR